MPASFPSKFAGKCIACNLRFPAGTPITWDPANSTAKHFPKCPEVSYDGAEQASIFEMWIQRAQETEVLQKQMRKGKNERG